MTVHYQHTAKVDVHARARTKKTHPSQTQTAESADAKLVNNTFLIQHHGSCADVMQHQRPCFSSLSGS